MKCFDNHPENIHKAVTVLKNGGIVAHPADTCFGLAADLTNPEALQALQAIKGRDGSKPMSIMFPAYLQAELGDYVLLDDFSEMVCNKLLPGPVTIVLPKGRLIPDYFFPQVHTVGIRIPYDLSVEDILTFFHGPLITTSANLSGKPVCCSCDDVRNTFKNQALKPDLLLRGRVHGLCLPSTVIRLGDEMVHVLREGPLKKDELKSILGVPVH